ncbi:TPA: hypothetical protein G8S59_003995 [Salmonella enterica]|uniref:Uncharacterized protein n=1 Tax=Salmonella enterica TaxID=28901 RepID=A0A757C8D2_SALER|nr:hypothetical protein [Salmonella enterica]
MDNYLTPKSLHDGELPPTPENIILTISQSDWKRYFFLPKFGGKITVLNKSNYSSSIDGFQINSNAKVIFHFNTSTKKWIISSFDFLNESTKKIQIPNLKECSSVIVDIHEEHYGSYALKMPAHPKFNEVIFQKNLGNSVFIELDGDVYILTPGKSPVDINNSLRLKFDAKTNKWNRVIPNGSLNAPWPWRNGRYLYKQEYFIIMPSDVENNPALNAGDIWYSLEDHSSYYTEDGFDDDCWNKVEGNRNLARPVIEDEDNGEIIIADHIGNFIKVDIPIWGDKRIGDKVTCYFGLHCQEKLIENSSDGVYFLFEKNEFSLGQHSVVYSVSDYLQNLSFSKETRILLK